MRKHRGSFKIHARVNFFPMVSSVEQFSIVALPLTCIQERAKSNAGCVRAGSEDERMFQA